ncbi:MAG: MFS transporter [Phototrophicaceae bacterium]
MLQNFFLRHLQYNGQARRFFMTIIALGFVIDGVYAVLLNLYLLRLGYDTQFIGQVNSAGLMAFALMSLPAGFFGTRWTSGRMLRIGMGGILLGASLLPMVEFAPVAWRASGMMLTYSMVLAGFSLYFVNAAPFLMSTVNSEQQNNAFALQTALLALAAFFGSLFGGNFPALITQFSAFTIDDPQPYRYTLLLTVVVVLVALAITLTIVQAPDDDEEEVASNDIAADTANVSAPIVTKKNITKGVMVIIGIMSLIRFLQVAGLATTSIFFNVYLDTELGISTSMIGTITAFARILVVPTVLLAPRLIRRSSNGTVATVGSLLTALALLPIALFPNGWVAASAYIFAIAATNLRFTAFIVYIMVIIPKKNQGVMVGAGETAAGLSFAVMALGGGYIASIFGFRELFLLGAVLSGLGTLIFWLHLQQIKRKQPII